MKSLQRILSLAAGLCLLAPDAGDAKAAPTLEAALIKTLQRNLSIAFRDETLMKDPVKRNACLRAWSETAFYIFRTHSVPDDQRSFDPPKSENLSCEYFGLILPKNAPAEWIEPLLNDPLAVRELLKIDPNDATLSKLSFRPEQNPMIPEYLKRSASPQQMLQQYEADVKNFRNWLKTLRLQRTEWENRKLLEMGMEAKDKK